MATHDSHHPTHTAIDTMIDTAPLHGSPMGGMRWEVGAIIDRGGEVLLVDRPASTLFGVVTDLPGGAPEPGETVTRALARTVAHDTGLSVSGVRELLGWSDYTTPVGLRVRRLVCAVDTDLTLGAVLEHGRCWWLAADDEPPIAGALAGIVSAYRRRHHDHNGARLGGGSVG